MHCRKYCIGGCIERSWGELVGAKHKTAAICSRRVGLNRATEEGTRGVQFLPCAFRIMALSVSGNTLWGCAPDVWGTCELLGHQPENYIVDVQSMLPLFRHIPWGGKLVRRPRRVEYHTPVGCLDHPWLRNFGDDQPIVVSGSAGRRRVAHWGFRHRFGECEHCPR